MTRFIAILKKEFRQIIRDRLSLGMLIFIPAFLLMLYGYALSFDVKHVRMAVLDEDNSRESRELMDSMFQNPYFDLKYQLSSRREIDALLDSGNVRAVMVIPHGYAAVISAARTADIQVVVDGANASSAATVIGYIEALIEKTNMRIKLDYLRSRGSDLSLPVVTPEPRVWFNPELESAHFLVPGLIGLLIMISAVIATSLSIVREKEKQTIEQIMVSPVKTTEFILAKTVPYILIGMLTVSIVLAMGYLLFGVAVKGSFIALGIVTVVFLFSALSMGVLISAITNSQQIAFQVAILTSLLPTLILSGFIFPIKNMPLPIQGVSFLVIPRYFVKALREIILKGADLSIVWPQILALLALGILFNMLAIRITRKAV